MFAGGLGVTLQDLGQPWWPAPEAGDEAFTQAIGRAAYDAGFEAVKLPSVRRKGGTNLNVFPERLREGSSVSVLAEEDLERLGLCMQKCMQKACAWEINM